MLTIKCKHCKALNKRNYDEVRPDFIHNHFYKLHCTECGKRTLVIYALNLIAIDDTEKHQMTEDILEKIVIK